MTLFEETFDFEGIIGHREVLDLLERDATDPTQTYLFLGPSGVGKATVARRFAARLIGGDDTDARRRVVGGVHPDLVVVQPEGRTSLTVDQARATVARAVLAPVEAARKVILIEDAGAMTDEAANALLKTLEEPSETTVFVLAAETEDDLPATVASRSRIVRFGRVSDDEIEAALTAQGVDPEQAGRVAVTAAGRPGIAFLLATRPEVAAFRQAWLSVPGRLDEQPGVAYRLAAELIDAAQPLLEGIADGQADDDAGKERIARERKRAAAALHVGGLEVLASWYRDAAAAQFGAPVRNRDVAGADLAGVAAATAVARAKRVLETIESLDANQRPDLAFAALFSDLGSPA